MCFYFPLPSNRLFPTINETSLTLVGGTHVNFRKVWALPGPPHRVMKASGSELGGCEFGQLKVITFVANWSSRQQKGTTLGKVLAAGATSKGKVIPCLMKHQATKAYRKNGSITPCILSLCTKHNWAGRFTLRPLHLLEMSPIITGKVTPRTDLDALKKRANFCPCRESTPYSPTVQAVA